MKMHFIRAFADVAADYVARAIHDRCAGCFYELTQFHMHQVCRCTDPHRTMMLIMPRLVELTPREDVIRHFRTHLYVGDALNQEALYFFSAGCPVERVRYNTDYQDDVADCLVELRRRALNTGSDDESDSDASSLSCSDIM